MHGIDIGIDIADTRFERDDVMCRTADPHL